MVIETLSAELERLFSLEELTELSQNGLGFDPQDVGGASAKGSFARALAQRCVATDSVEALFDVIRAQRKEPSEQATSLLNGGLALEPPLSSGDQIGEYLLIRELGKGPTARCFHASNGGSDVRLRVLHSTVQRRDAQRYLAASRLSMQAFHGSLPTDIYAGPLDAQSGFLGVSQEYVQGEPLSEWLEREGPRHFNGLLPLLWAIAEPLGALHAAGIAHGALHLNNVIVTDPSPAAPKVLLVDVGANLLRPSLSASKSKKSPRWMAGVAPEQLRDGKTDLRSDLYAFGALVYELVSGRAPFSGSAIDVAVGHLSGTAEPLSFVAPGNGATPGVESFVNNLLEKDPERRPRDASEMMEGLRRLWNASTRPPSWVTDERLPELFQALAEHPEDEEAAAQLEATIDLGADPRKLADSFYQVAREVRSRNDPALEKPMVRLLTRAARLYEKADVPETAEKIYKGLLKLDPDDRATAKALDRLRKNLGKHEELIESLLERSEASRIPSERADLMAQIGEIYATALNDKEQALVAYTTAFCEDPTVDAYAEAVERYAGTRYQAWEEVLGRCLEASESEELDDDGKRELLLRMGLWYAHKVNRADLAIPWLSKLLEIEPSNERALAELSQVYRKAQQWSELVQILGRRADVAAPNAARDYRAEAAELCLTKLGNPALAQELWEAVLVEDPGHERAVEGLVGLLKQNGDVARAVKVLEARAAAISGEPRHKLLCEIAETYEVDLDNLDGAERALRSVIAENPNYLDALRGLDRVYNRTGRYRELVDNLHRQVELAVTARQKITLLERIAGIADEEFLDSAAAAEALEQVLALDVKRHDAARELARHYRKLGRFQELADLYQTQIDNADTDEVKLEAWLGLGKVQGEDLKQPYKAISAYEEALKLSPGHAGALNALAVLRATAGDAESALDAIEALAEAAQTPREKAEQYLRAAALLDERGDADGAILQLKRAIDVCPDDPSARNKLRAKYLALHNYSAVVELLEEQLENAKGELTRAKLAGEIAVLCQRHLHDDERANSMALLANHLDPTNLDALRVMGLLAHQEERYVEASKRLEPVISQLEGMSAEEASDVAFTYIDALAKSGSEDKAMIMAEGLYRWFANDATAMLRVAEISAEHGSPEQTLALCESLLENPNAKLSPREEAETRRRAGECLTQLGRIGEALSVLEDAAKLDPRSPEPLDAIVKAYSSEERWDKALETLYRKLEISVASERIPVLLQMGDIAATKLKNADYAAKSYLLALSERPNDRDILAKLMQLYGSERDWPKLIQVITKLAEVVEDAKHKAKYLHTASMIASRELGDTRMAQTLLDRAINYDPELQAAVDEALALRQKARDYDGVKDLLKLRIQQATAADNQELLLQSLWQLADVYERHLHKREQAIAVCESGQEVDPDNPRWQERLARLYAEDPSLVFDKAAATIGAWIERDPYQPEPYKLMRRIYTSVRHADGAWLACQALHVLGHAGPDETKFYQRMKNDEPAAAQDTLLLQDWPELLLPSANEPVVTSLMSILQAYVLAARGRKLEAYGLTPEHQLDMERYPYGLVYTLHYASEVLGIPEPPFYQNQDDQGGLSFLHTSPPSVSLGAAVFASELPPATAQFLAGRHLTYYLPGFYMRQLLPNMTALKSWVFAAFRLVKPKFPVAAELEPLVAQASQALAQVAASSAGREQLTDVVTRLLRSEEALDLKRWANMVDFVADRAGFVMAQDLEAAVAVIRSLPADEATPPPAVRVEKLLAYSVSEQYINLRARLGIAVG